MIFVEGLAGQRCPSGLLARHSPLGIASPEDVSKGTDRALEPLGALTRLLLAQVALGDVAEEYRQAPVVGRIGAPVEP